ncbi:heme ABC transporter ATP-binding protein/permease CydC [Thorsellia anophelis]|uniref:ATP-binding cassette, subfamily C, CydC n=1 Tax=Thorsellia anophelis DSM 18579 TaxID=1123402 RepID=A0A1I0C1R7_9GAMM|nr:cysteine/glutathione ABC transporter ATP-binding protein/permease CydC [Thorsellia anophelis]SET13320.1 ATP-binding cassette, subfamily C, CydC [Thorsellia anophelis DSM 18579]
MLKILKPFLLLYKNHLGWLLLGLFLSITTLLATIGLLTLSGWFLAGSAIAGIVGFATYNYLLPAAFVRGFAIGRTASRYFERVVTHEATFRLLAQIRISVFESIFPRYTTLTQTYRQADLLNRLITDVETLDNLYLRVITPLLSAAIVIIGLTTVLAYFNFSLALMLGSILSFILITFPFIFHHLAKPVGYKIVQLRSDYRQALNRLLNGQTVLLIYDKWYSGIKDLANLESNTMAEEAKQSFQTQLASAAILILAGLTVCIMIYFVGAFIIETGTEPVLNMPAENSFFHVPTYDNSVIFSAIAALFVFATLSVFEMLVPVSQAFVHLGLVLASAERINKINELSPFVEFASPTTNIKERHDSKAKTALNIVQLSFTYPSQVESVLNDVTLVSQPLEKIAIIGKTGSGKSTLFQILTRAFPYQGGKIELLGRRIEEYSEAELRQLITVVPQKIYLFNDTLRDNILIALNPKYELKSDDADAGHELIDRHLISILKQVGLERLLEGAGLDQIMGDGGRSLSGGELRRIGIARALLHNGDIWLLDEPTEGLDAVTEQNILDLIFEVTKDKTMLMVTHRKTNLDKFNRVFSVENKLLIMQ